MSFQLLLPFVRQPQVDLLLNTTATPAASHVFQFLKFAQLPQTDYDVPYFWVTQPARFLSAALWKKGLPPPWCQLGGVAAAPALWLESRAARHGGCEGPVMFLLELTSCEPRRLDRNLIFSGPAAGGDQAAFGGAQQ